MQSTRLLLLTSLLASDPVGAGYQQKSPARPQSRAAVRLDEPKVEGWRYKWHNGHWWYYQPSRKWLFWNGRSWTEYSPATYREFLSWRAYVTQFRGVSPFDMPAQKGPGFSDSGEIYQNRD